MCKRCRLWYIQKFSLLSLWFWCLWGARNHHRISWVGRARQAARGRDLKKKLETDSFTSQVFYDKFVLGGREPPRLCGPPRIPRLSNSPYHNTALWVINILEPVHKSLAIRSINESFTFVILVKTQDVSDITMPSPDIESLFTNVPLSETVDCICQ